MDELYTVLFEHSQNIPCPPYEPEYGMGHIFIKTQCLADIAGFYRAFGLEVSPGGERPDHIAAEMEFMHFLTFKEACAHHQGEAEGADRCRQAQLKFLSEHLGCWVAGFADETERVAQGSFYAQMARLAALFVEGEVEGFRLKPELLALRPQSPVSGDDPAREELDCEGCPLIDFPSLGQAR